MPLTPSAGDPPGAPPVPMIALRSFLFNLLFYVNLVVWMIVCLPVLAMSHRAMIAVARGWSNSSIWLLRVVAGTRVEYRGLEHIPPHTGFLVVAKHQSFLETFAIFARLEDAAFILKRELMWIPLFGWYLAKCRMIPIDRGSRAAAITAMNRRAREEVAAGRQIMIFPEGTRRPPGAPPAYKLGFSHLYETLGAPILPVALNTGLFWPRRQAIRRPGTAVIEFLPIISPGMPREEVLARTQAVIETACDRLLAEGRAALGAAAPVSAAPASDR